MIKAVLWLLLYANLFAIEFAPNQPGDYDKGYKDGYNILSLEMFRKNFTDIYHAQSTMDRAIARSVLRDGSLVGTCQKYTYYDTKNKSINYLSGFKKGCAKRSDEIYRASFDKTTLRRVIGSQKTTKQKYMYADHLLTGKTTFKKLQSYLRQNNKDAISQMIKYPLKRLHGLPPIMNKAEMVHKFRYIFDKKLTNTILNATEKDLTQMGTQGTMLKDGLLWFRDQKIIAINYHSKKEPRRRKKSETNIYPTLANFKENKLNIITTRFHVRIDELKDGTLRYASWAKKKAQTQKPDLVLKGGSLSFDGSGGNHHYIFKKGIYKYVIYISVLGYNDSLGYLKVYKNNSMILEEPIIANGQKYISTIKDTSPFYNSEKFIRSTLQRWETANNTKNIKQLSALYANRILYYGKIMDRKHCIKDKKRFFKRYPSFHQEAEIDHFGSIDAHTYKVFFDKYVTMKSNGKKKKYSSYLTIKMISGAPYIIEEGDQ